MITHLTKKLKILDFDENHLTNAVLNVAKILEYILIIIYILILL